MNTKILLALALAVVTTEASAHKGGNTTNFSPGGLKTGSATKNFSPGDLRTGSATTNFYAPTARRSARR
jgi:hypothetical protein